MRPTTTLLPFLSLLPTTLSHGIPLLVSPGINISTSHQPPSCSDLSTGIAGITSACYANLNITNYMINYNLSIRPETCAPYQPWSQCFLNFAYAAPAPPDTPIPININRTHDCSHLAVNTLACPPPTFTNQIHSPQLFYALANIYTLQHHLSLWAQALAAPASQAGILSALNHPSSSSSSTTTTTTTLLTTLLSHYGTKPPADTALVGLLTALPPTSSDEQTGTAALTPAQWQPLLHAQLAAMLALAMRDFDAWIAVVEGGVFCGGGLAGEGVGGLEGALAKGGGR